MIIEQTLLTEVRNHSMKMIKKQLIKNSERQLNSINESYMCELSDYYLSSNKLTKWSLKKKIPRMNVRIFSHNLLVKIHNYLCRHYLFICMALFVKKKMSQVKKIRSGTLSYNKKMRSSVPDPLNIATVSHCHFFKAEN